MCVFLFVASFYLFSCSTQKYTASVDFNFKEENISPDYSSLDYWAAHPFKKDPSDNIPEDLKGDQRIQ